MDFDNLSLKQKYLCHKLSINDIITHPQHPNIPITINSIIAQPNTINIQSASIDELSAFKIDFIQIQNTLNLNWDVDIKKNIPSIEHEPIVRLIQKWYFEYSTTCEETLYSKISGCIIHGKSGTGKTMLASALTKTSNLYHMIIKSTDLYTSKREYDAEKFLLQAFKTCDENKPSIMVFDDIDMIASKTFKNLSLHSNSEQRIFQILLDFLDNRQNNVFIMGITNRIYDLNPELLRYGRLHTLLPIIVSTKYQRLSILKSISQKSSHLILDSEVLGKVSQITQGFVGSDLASLYRHVVLQNIQTKSAQKIRFNDFAEALTDIKPASIHEFAAKIPEVYFKDIFGIKDIILKLQKSIINPYIDTKDFEEMGIHKPRGILLHGPSGVGKSKLSFALVNEMGLSCIYVDGPKIRSKIVGESEANIAKIFSQARANSPCILLIDQLDMIVPKRGTDITSENTGERIVTCFLTEMDGVLSSKGDSTSDILIVAITSRIHAIDSAILRPGRLDDQVYIPLPDKSSRKEIIAGLLSDMPHIISEEELLHLSENTEGYTGADIENMCREAVLRLIRNNMQTADINNLFLSINDIRLENHSLS